MIVLNGIKNFLQFVNDNWTIIAVMIGLLVSVYQKVRGFIAMSQEQQETIAKKQIKEIILSLISNAEADYDSIAKSGQIKRAQVIAEIFKLYPILTKAVDQKEITEYIDKCIDEALVTLRQIVEENIHVEE